jgi:hypothetical protein
VFHEDAVNITAAPEYSRGVVVALPALGELFLLAAAAGLLRENLEAADTPAHARFWMLSLSCPNESLADEASERW